jgi:hypothetical protein
MAKFITSIKLQEANERDYAKLSQEKLKKYLFSPVGKSGSGKTTGSSTSLTFNSTDNKSLLDTTTAISRAAATTGRKFSFTVIREKIKTDFK